MKVVEIKVHGWDLKCSRDRKKLPIGKENKKGYHKNQMLKYWLIKAWLTVLDVTNYHVKQYITSYTDEVLPGSGLGSLTGSWSQLPHR